MCEEFYQAKPLPIPEHKVSGMTMKGQRRIYYDHETRKITESLIGTIEGHRMPMVFNLNSISEMDPVMVKELISELDRALQNYSFAVAS